MHDAPRRRKQDEEDRKRIEIGGPALEIELEQAQHRPHGDALQAVRAAGEPAQRIGELVQQRGDAERHHQARQVVAAQDQRRCDEAKQSRSRHGEHQPGDRVRRHMQRQQPRSIRAKAEECGMAQRNNAGITQDEIQRDGEQRQNRNFIQDDQLARKHEEHRQGQRPKQRLERMPAPGCRQREPDLFVQRIARHARLRANRPSGFSSSTLTISA